MNQTQNLHLPQWEADDRIMRTDFNDAMASIDAAVAAKADTADLPAAITAASPIVKLKDVTLDADTVQWDIDMMDVNLSGYSALLLYPAFLSDGNEPVYLRLNDISDNYYRESGQQKAYFLSFSGPRTSLHQAVIRRAPTFYSALCQNFSDGGSQSASAGAINSSWLDDTITSLNFVAYTNKHILSGSRIVLYGLR